MAGGNSGDGLKHWIVDRPSGSVTVSIVIPSRLAASGQKDATSSLMLERAVSSVRAQTIANQATFQILVGIDPGASVPEHLATDQTLRFVEARVASQAAALNAAAAFIAGDVVAFLEDDDEWQPNFLEIALAALQHTDFVSSTQLEVNDERVVQRVNDFATPSGWVMKRATWDTVGPFDEAFRWHLDNEWLGRLAMKGFSRAHLVEATAPINPRFVAQMRPWLANVLRDGGDSVRLVRHGSPWPLVTRLVHPDSGMERMGRDADLTAQSQREIQAIAETYGRMPW